MRLLFLLALFAASPELPAQSADFARLDRDGDGRITRQEARAEPEIHKRFAQFDTDRDARLSLEEYLIAREDNERRAQRDALLTERVKAALSAQIPFGAIAIDTYEGAVQLSGYVPAADMASRAGRITASISGVRTVHNNLLVRQRQQARMQ